MPSDFSIYQPLLLPLLFALSVYICTRALCTYSLCALKIGNNSRLGAPKLKLFRPLRWKLGEAAIYIYINNYLVNLSLKENVHQNY